MFSHLFFPYFCDRIKVAVTFVFLKIHKDKRIVEFSRIFGIGSGFILWPRHFHFVFPRTRKFSFASWNQNILSKVKWNSNFMSQERGVKNTTT